jgi:phosphoribosylpyrophosphate synthetase
MELRIELDSLTRGIDLPDGRSLVKIFHLGHYHPRTLFGRGRSNPGFDDWSQNILNLKSHDRSAMEFFRLQLQPVLWADPVVSAIPPSKAGAALSGIQSVAKALTKTSGVDATPALVRHKSIDKQATGGKRSVQQHLDSLRVAVASLVAGRSVVLLDDVCTTGYSMVACQWLLLQAGATSVTCVALGQTVRDEE